MPISVPVPKEFARRYDKEVPSTYGEQHAVSPNCTHMGCLVAFNGVEKAWECPCHGSRFGLDGAVLQGPATKPLRRRDGDR